MFPLCMVFDLQGSICIKLKGSTASLKTPIGDGSMSGADAYSAGAVPITEWEIFSRAFLCMNTGLPLSQSLSAYQWMPPMIFSVISG